MSNRGANGAHNGVVVVSVQGVQKHLIVRVQFFKHHQPLIICGNLVDGLKRQNDNSGRGMREECLDDAMLSSVIKSLPREHQVCVPLNHPKLPRGHSQSCANPDTGRTSIFFLSDRIVSVGSPGIHHPGGECATAVNGDRFRLGHKDAACTGPEPQSIQYAVRSARDGPSTRSVLTLLSPAALAAREFERPGNGRSAVGREWGVSATHRSRRRSGAGA